jgi:Dolichyl-phosphate-mannose-protein mannosyltransferase
MTMQSNAQGSIRQNEPARFSQVILVVLICSVFHLILFANDVQSGYRAFAWGDRGEGRVSFLQEFTSTPHTDVIASMVFGGTVPGEYLFVLGPYLAFGIAGVIMFQIALSVASAAATARLGAELLPFRFSALITGLLYTLIPQNLVYPHQLVTEAIATPLCVGWLYFTYQGLMRSSRGSLIVAGLLLGIAIFVRPSLFAIILTFPLLALFIRRLRFLLTNKWIYAMLAVAAAPLLTWTAIFTTYSGHLGYTNGIATLSWNLRDKARAVELANDIPPSASLASDRAGISLREARYLDDSGGISLREFGQIALEHPVPFLKEFVLDAVVVFGRGNTTKFTVDYLGIERDQKNWRDGLLYDKSSARDFAKFLKPYVIIEVLTSALTLALSCVCLIYLVHELFGSGSGQSEFVRSQRVVFSALSASLIAHTFLSAELVGESQGRLRNPAEAAMIITAGLAYHVFRSRRHLHRRDGSSFYDQ